MIEDGREETNYEKMQARLARKREREKEGGRESKKKEVELRILDGRGQTVNWLVDEKV